MPCPSLQLVLFLDLLYHRFLLLLVFLIYAFFMILRAWMFVILYLLPVVCVVLGLLHVGEIVYLGMAELVRLRHLLTRG